MMNERINCAEYLESACSTINLPLQAIKRLFFSKEIYETYYSCKDEKDFMLEIWFDMVSFLCVFDENNICEKVFLLLDNLAYIADYIEYCNTTYPYNMILKGWVLRNCLIQIDINNEVCCLTVVPVKQG